MSRIASAAPPGAWRRLGAALARPRAYRLDPIRVHGDALFTEADPVLEEHEGAIFVPQTGATLTQDTGWGLFDRSGVPIAAAAYRRGPGPIRVGGGERAPEGFATLPILDEAPYLYVGHLSSHFGHFLLTSIARLWPRLRGALPEGTRLLYHAPEPPGLWFALSWTGAILRALDLTPDDFVQIDAPVRVGRVFVPGPSFEELHGAHRVHGELGAAIGARLVGAEPSARSTQPLYLSRTRLERGTHRIANEAELEAALVREGCAVAHPEELDLAEQIRLFESHGTIVSLVGSALHASLLSRVPSRIVGLAMQPLIHSDYGLVDRLRGNRARYLFAATREEDATDTTFHRIARFTRPDRVIDQVLRAIEALGRESA